MSKPNLWTSVLDSMPPDSSMVYVTNGREIGTAHWFNKSYKPSTGESFPGSWANPSPYIDRISHWAFTLDILDYLLSGLSEATLKFCDDCGIHIMPGQEVVKDVGVRKELLHNYCSYCDEKHNKYRREHV